jgi:poly-gamma-glutamate synthesis protein (capsule biosynthesis protein)
LRAAGPVSVSSGAAVSLSSGAQISAVGDLVIDYGYMEEILKKIRKEQSPLAALDYPFKRVKPGIQGIGFGNLESPATEHGIKAFADKNERFYFRTSPRAVRSIARAGFKVISLANNHIKDCGVAGLLETQAQVRYQGLQPVGAGKDRTDARRPVLLRDGGEDVAFLAYVLVPPKSVWATALTPGAASGVTADLIADVMAARSRTANVVVSLHWGVERKHDLPVPEPSAAQSSLAHALIDAGACLILGQHDHTAGRLEEYKQGLIAYSLGNFIFGGSVRGGHTHSYILQARISQGRVQDWGLLPVQTEVDKVRYQPAPVLGDEAQRLEARYVPAAAAHYQALHWESLLAPTEAPLSPKSIVKK